MDLRVATFNVRNGIAWDGWDSWPLRRRATADAVARLDADLVGLQEAYGFQQRYLLRRLPGYAAAGVGRTDGRRRGERCAVFYRPRLRLERQHTRWFCDTPDVPGTPTWEARMPRIATLAWFVDARSGRRFGFANAHLEGASRLSRERSVALLLDWLEPGLPWVVAGDMNATPSDPAIRRLVEAGLRDVAREAASRHPDEPGPGGAAGVPEPTCGGRRIDYLFVTPEWEVGADGVVRPAHRRRRPSDHDPLVAGLSLP